ncbi:unnamed protein product [Lathyrus sativus]|nr:unnamed protein product [Lathyrus sativus]
MDRTWMKADRLGPIYEKGVLEFLKYADQNLPGNNGIFYCSCVNCGNIKKGTEDEILHHLCCDGVYQNYTICTWHGEVEKNQNLASQSNEVNEEEYMDDCLEDMFCDIGKSSFKKAHIYDDLCSDKDTPLYKGCTSFTRLSAVLKLFNPKANNGWSDKSFTELLHFLKQMILEDNDFPDRCYDAKKILCPIGFKYIKIHACPNDCILYKKEFENFDQCPKYGVSRYKLKDNNGDDNNNGNVSRKRPPAKVRWYLPIISRFKRPFANADDAKNIRWHANERKYDGNICHVADSL